MAFEPGNPRPRTQQAAVARPPILESTFSPGSRSGRVQAQSRLRTQQFDQSIVQLIPPQN
ncbi:hypothetical protein PoB_005540800, partial [Plakobranchus ocellatus]